MTAVTEGPARIVTLDVLRGVAVMGILVMNAVVFAMPRAASFNPAVYGGQTLLDHGLWLVNFVFIDGKMRGLFSLLFGASMLLVIEAAKAKGESPAAVHYRRILWLLVFGAIHFYLIWRGDILLHYALVALVAFVFHRVSLKTLIFCAGLLVLYDLLIMLGLSGGVVAASAAASQPGADPAIVAQWAALRDEIAPLSPQALAADLAIHRDGWTALARHRWTTEASMPLDVLEIAGPETLALMLIGMAGLRSGFLTGAWSPAQYRRVAIAGILFGAAGFALIAAVFVRSDFDPATVFAGYWGGTVIFRLPMILGYAALIILIARRGGAVIDRLAAAGRAAFSNYLGASVVMTFLFYGWGLGLYGRVDRGPLSLIVLGGCALMLLWSKPWLDRYRYGPLEWLWRTLARGRRQPMRKPPFA